MSDLDPMNRDSFNGVPMGPAEPDWHHRCDIAACNCGRCHQCGEIVPEPDEPAAGLAALEGGL